MAGEERCREESWDGPVGFWLMPSIKGCLLGFVVGGRIPLFTALVTSCVIGALLGWRLRYESHLLEDDG